MTPYAHDAPGSSGAQPAPLAVDLARQPIRKSRSERVEHLLNLAQKLRCDPLELMLLEIRDLLDEAGKRFLEVKTAEGETVTLNERRAIRRSLRSQAIDVATRVAPYLHPRLASLELTGDEDKPIHISVDEVRDQLAGAILGLAAARGAGGEGEGDAGKDAGGEFSRRLVRLVDVGEG